MHGMRRGDESKPTENAAEAGGAEITVIKSPEDPREYKHIVLDNGLACLLIVDHELAQQTNAEEKKQRKRDDDGDEDGDDDDVPKQVACSMSVGVGYFSDPDHVPGLAHFVEHMLFLGTKKYPIENEWESYISERGGYSNATTDAELTNYHFEVSPDALESSLDRFAQFFIGPLFTASGTQRELRAIENEHVASLNADDMRRWQVLFESVRDGHPLQKFSCGTIETLETKPQKAGVDVRQLMIDFVKRYYYAESMKLCVFGTDMSELERMVRASFSGIPSRAQREAEAVRDAEAARGAEAASVAEASSGSPHSKDSKNGFEKESMSNGGRRSQQITEDTSTKPVFTAPNFKHCGMPFDSGSLQTLFKVVPTKERHELVLTFALPSLLDEYRALPTEVVADLIHHEGRGSVFSLLRRKGLVNEMEAGVERDGASRNTSCYIFEVSMTLTDKGLSQYLEVIDYVFQYITMLRQRGIPRRHLDESKQLSEMCFRFRSKHDPINVVESHADWMHFLPPEHVLVGDEILLEHNEDLLKSIINILVPSNCRVTLSSRDFEGKTDRVEQWLNVHYSKEPIEQSLIAQWSKPKEIHPELDLPGENTFIPRDFSLYSRRPSIENDDSPPQLVIDDDSCRIFYKLDDHFRLPKARAVFMFETPKCYDTPKGFVVSDVFVSMVADSLTEVLYPAELAELSYSLSCYRRGIEMVVEGFNCRLFHFAETIVKRMASFEPDADRFAIIKERHLRAWHNMYFEVGAQAGYTRLLLLQQRKWTCEELTSACEQLTLEDIRDGMKTLFRSFFLEGLVHGNVTRKHVLDLIKSFKDVLGGSALSPSERYEERVVQLPVGHTLMVTTMSRSPKASNSAIHCYYQVGPTSLRLNVLLNLLIQVMYEPSYDHLRTKEQLGYEVACRVQDCTGVLGILIYVVSGSHTIDHVTSRIEAFMRDAFPQMLRSMTQKEFKTHIDTMVMERKYPYTNLKDLSKTIWREISDHRRNHVFDRRLKEIAQLWKFTKSDLIDLYEAFFHPVRLQSRATPSRASQPQLLSAASSSGDPSMNGSASDSPPNSSKEAASNSVAKALSKEATPNSSDAPSSSPQAEKTPTELSERPTLLDSSPYARRLFVRIEGVSAKPTNEILGDADKRPSATASGNSSDDDTEMSDGEDSGDDSDSEESDSDEDEGDSDNDAELSKKSTSSRRHTADSPTKGVRDKVRKLSVHSQGSTTSEGDTPMSSSNHNQSPPQKCVEAARSSSSRRHSHSSSRRHSHSHGRTHSRTPSSVGEHLARSLQTQWGLSFDSDLAGSLHVQNRAAIDAQTLHMSEFIEFKRSRPLFRDVEAS